MFLLFLSKKKQVKHPPYLNTLFQLNQTRNEKETLHIIFPEQPATEDSEFTQDYLAISLRLLIPSPKLVLHIFPTTIDERTAMEASLDFFRPVVVDSTPRYGSAMPQAAPPTEKLPKSCVAISKDLQGPISDADDTNHNLYFLLAWDGSSDFNGGAPLVPPGEYYVVVVAEGVYGEYGQASVWASPKFQMTRTSDVNIALRSKKSLGRNRKDM
ncbi:hypothetical protein BDR26DRAFT_395318 [Obelidium mucronatum]|nr:hypothetical protein BDR26DRAFT_395318 [Obelidium mucronatum]